MSALFDTNILIDHLSGHCPATQAILGQPARYISRITWIEVMAGSGRPGQSSDDLRAFLTGFSVIELDGAISEVVVTIRAGAKIKVPDAIILATARSRQLPLMTRNTKDFPPGMPDVVVPYTVTPAINPPVRKIIP